VRNPQRLCRAVSIVSRLKVRSPVILTEWSGGGPPPLNRLASHRPSRKEALPCISFQSFKGQAGSCVLQVTERAH
jgi:hypothetical protein